MTEKKPQMEFTPWGLQPMKARMDDESILARSHEAVDALAATLGDDWHARAMRDLAVTGQSAVEVTRSDGGEDIVMKHVDIRTGPMPTEMMDRLVHEECRPTYDAELERARRNVERFAQLDNAEHAYEDYCERSARITAREEAKHGASVTGALLGLSMVLLGLLAAAAIGFGTYGLVHMLIDAMF